MLETIEKPYTNRIQPTGNFKSLSGMPHGLIVETDSCKFDVVFYDSSIVRIHRYGDTQDTNPYSVIQEPIDVNFSVDERSRTLHVLSDRLGIRIDKFPVRFTFLNRQGKIINEDDPRLGIQSQGDLTTVYKKLQEGERFVGLGEKTGSLDRRGCGYQNWNTDHFAYGPDADPIYASIPFYIGIHNNLSYGIFLDNTYKTHFNFGASNNRFSSFSMDAGDLDYYFFSGDVSEIASSYTWLTGRMELPALWSIGYQQCRYSYYPDSEVLEVAQKFRTKNIPADVVVLDIHHMDGYKIFSWDKERFPDPRKMNDQLRALGFETTVICNPGIKTQEGYGPYLSGVENDIFVKYPDGSYYEGEVWPGWCHFPDFTKEEARNWWKEMMKFYSQVGVKGFWNDMNEIATWGQMLPENILFDYEGEGATSRKARNIYGLQMTKSSLEGARENLKGERSFILTRAGFSGVQRYSALWVGDNVANDDHMLLGVRLVNSLGLSGVSFAGCDVGGFVDDGHSKLFARWVQIGAFSPFFRGHSMINSNDSEPWSYGEEVEEIAANYISLRYKLLPYLYQSFLESTENGLPVSRSLVFDYAHVDKIYDPQFENQYLFGDSILVAPIRSDAQFIKVYLPEGRWYEFFTDERFEGDNELIREYDLEHAPFFVKSSSIIPVYPEVGANTKEIGDVLELHIYKGEEVCSTEYYEDDGTTYDYEERYYHKRKLVFDPKSKQFELQKAEGTYPSNIKKLRLVFHGFEEEGLEKIEGTRAGEYSFVKPISHFDPMGEKKPHTLRSKNVYIIEKMYSNEELVIHW